MTIYPTTHVNTPPQIQVVGKSGNRYAFSAYEVGMPFINAPGIYIFSRRTPDGKWEAIYVGQSSNLEDRIYLNLRQHHKLDRIARHNPTHIAVMFVAGTDGYRVAVETDIRGALPTPCNDQ
jgi:hypothetical protein